VKNIEKALETGSTKLLLTPQSSESAISEATALLEGEAEIPINVLKVIDYCTKHKIGFVLSRNERAGNCRDARSKRRRLGHVGIPLYDEIKSKVVLAKDQTGAAKIVAMHCRGHMTIDFDAVSQLCQFRVTDTPLPEAELQELFGMKFGTVNPVLININSSHRILNLFDSGLLQPISVVPGTMMTNAGEHSWGIELDPRELIASTNAKLIGDIAVPDDKLQPYELPHVRNPKTIGIITGNGPDSGIALWEDINQYFVEILGVHFLGDISLPKVSIVSVPAMGLSMELERRETATWEALSEAVYEIKQQQVELLALACHTTHYFTDKIRAIFDSDGQRFISMPDVVVDYLDENEITELAILGIGYVADLGKWSAYSMLSKYRVEKLSASTLEKFRELGYEVKKMSQRHKSFLNLTRLLRHEVKSKNVIVALTELSILLQSQSKKERPSEKNIIDALELYAKAIAKASLGLN
jgi:aspartate racemase